MDRRHDNANHKPVDYGQSVAVYRFGSITECLQRRTTVRFQREQIRYRGADTVLL
jgi:hypothetical protein